MAPLRILWKGGVMTRKFIFVLTLFTSALHAHEKGIAFDFVKRTRRGLEEERLAGLIQSLGSGTRDLDLTHLDEILKHDGSFNRISLPDNISLSLRKGFTRNEIFEERRMALWCLAIRN